MPSRELPSHGSIIIILKDATLHMQLHAFHFLVSQRIKLSFQNIKIIFSISTEGVGGTGNRIKVFEGWIKVCKNHKVG